MRPAPRRRGHAERRRGARRAEHLWGVGRAVGRGGPGSGASASLTMAAPRGSLGEDLAAQPEEAPVLPVAAAMAAAQRALGDAVHADARAAYATQRALEEECREARDAARRFAAAAARWRKVTHCSER